MKLSFCLITCKKYRLDSIKNINLVDNDAWGQFIHVDYEREFLTSRSHTADNRRRPVDIFNKENSAWINIENFETNIVDSEEISNGSDS